MFPNQLKPGDEIRVIAPSSSLAIVKDEQIKIAVNRLKEMGKTFQLFRM
jgi:muramoyltetrapeptide carboxypeptidase